MGGAFYQVQTPAIHGHLLRPGEPFSAITSIRLYRLISLVRPKGADHQWGKDPLK
jgi:hypothetical protein